jgi:hypothetical protein
MPGRFRFGSGMTPGLPYRRSSVSLSFIQRTLIEPHALASHEAVCRVRKQRRCAEVLVLRASESPEFPLRRLDSRRRGCPRFFLAEARMEVVKMNKYCTCACGDVPGVARDAGVRPAILEGSDRSVGSAAHGSRETCNVVNTRAGRWTAPATNRGGDHVCPGSLTCRAKEREERSGARCAADRRMRCARASFRQQRGWADARAQSAATSVAMVPMRIGKVNSAPSHARCMTTRVNSRAGNDCDARTARSWTSRFA